MSPFKGVEKVTVRRTLRLRHRPHQQLASAYLYWAQRPLQNPSAAFVSALLKGNDIPFLMRLSHIHVSPESTEKRALRFKLDEKNHAQSHGFTHSPPTVHYRNCASLILPDTTENFYFGGYHNSDIQVSLDSAGKWS